MPRHKPTPTPPPDGIPVDDFGSRLALVRNWYSWNVSQAAEACSTTGFPISDQNWSNWEDGARPRDLLVVVDAIARATMFSEQWLLNGGPAHQVERGRSRRDFMTRSQGNRPSTWSRRTAGQARRSSDRQTTARGALAA